MLMTHSHNYYKFPFTARSYAVAKYKDGENVLLENIVANEISKHRSAAAAHVNC